MRQGAGSVQKGNGKTGSRIPMWPEAGEILEITPCIIFCSQEKAKRQEPTRMGWELGLTLAAPNSDENEISLYIITTCSNIQVMRIKEVITKDKMP